MKQPKMTNLTIDQKSTKELRSKMAKAKKIKITINIDEESLSQLRNISSKTGMPYQKLLNQLLKDGLKKHDNSESRLDRLERELEELKKRVA